MKEDEIRNLGELLDNLWLDLRLVGVIAVICSRTLGD